MFRRILAAVLLASLALGGCDVALVAYFATKDDGSKGPAAPNLQYSVYVRMLGAGDLNTENTTLTNADVPPAPWVWIQEAGGTIERDLTSFNVDAILLWNLQRDAYKVDAVEEITGEGSTLRTATVPEIKDDDIEDEGNAAGYPDGVTTSVSPTPTGHAHLLVKFPDSLERVRISAYVTPGTGDVEWVRTKVLGGDQTSGGAAANSAGVLHVGFVEDSNASALLWRVDTSGNDVQFEGSAEFFSIVGAGTFSPGSVAIAIETDSDAIAGNERVWIARKNRPGGIRISRYPSTFSSIDPPSPNFPIGSDSLDRVDHNGLALDSNATPSAFIAGGLVVSGNLAHYLQRVDSSGGLWPFPPAPPTDPNATYWAAVDAATANHVFVGGDFTTNTTGPVIEGYLARFAAADGAAGWSRTDGAPAGAADTSPDRFRAIVSDGAGNLWAGGGFETAGNRNGIILQYPAALTSTPPAGSTTFGTLVGSAGLADEILDLARDSNTGAIFACGYETATGPNQNIWVRKYSSAGAMLWTRTFDAPAGAADRAVSIVLSGNSLYVFGEVTTAGNGKDPHVRKYVK